MHRRQRLRHGLLHMVTRLEGCELRYTEWVRYEGERANWAPTWDAVYTGGSCTTMHATARQQTLVGIP